MLYVADFVPEPDPADGLISRVSMAKYILRLMAEDYSQCYHFVSWTHDMAFVLWSDVHGNVQEAAFGETQLSQSKRQLFLDLAKTADGWWLDIHANDAFIPLCEWEEMVAGNVQED